MTSALIRILVPIGIWAVLGLWMVFLYPRLAMATTGEYWTNIIRRNSGRLAFPIIGVALGLLAWGSRGVYPETYGVIIGFYGVLVGHFYWAGLRPGEIHRPTSWRCVEELSSAGHTDAAKFLGDRLEALEYSYPIFPRWNPVLP